MSSSGIEDRIRTEARRLGFAAAGFAEAGDACGSNTLDQWLDQEFAGSMDYLRRHSPLRRHPASISPDVRSIIAVAARYPANPQPGQGFCITARTLDYHDILRAKLEQMADFIRGCTAARTLRICIDSAPLPEREWAQRAGLGWQGRQGQLVSTEAGACTVLGFLLTDITLQPSEPQPDQCGDCRRCVESCPSGAIQPDRQVDARRCISYLTIEHRGDIEPALQRVTGQALFGCDICTAACPLNRTATAPLMPELCPPPNPMPSAAELAAMPPGVFTERFRGTAVKRSGVERLQRNALMALQNQAD